MQPFLTQLGTNALAAGLVVGSNVLNVIPTPNATASALKTGISQIVAEDIVNYMTGKRSLILNMDYINLIDQSVFASAFVYGVNYSGLTNYAITTLDSVSPLGEMVNDAIVNGGLIMLNRTVSDMMDSSAAVTQTPLVYLNHPSMLVMG